MVGWSLEPSVLSGAFGLAAVYLVCVGPWRPRFLSSAPVGPWRLGFFLAGVAVLILALASPLDLLSDHYLLTAHMLQHMLLTLLLPPLLLLGTPGWLLRPLLQSPLIAASARVITRPLPAFILFNLIFTLSHFPVFYNLTLADEHVHILEHEAYMIAAVITWWPILSPLSELPRLPYPVQMLYLFLQTLPGALVGAMIALSREVIYPLYAAAPRLTWMSPLEDQQLGGLIMWIGSTMWYFAALSIVFFIWAAREERRAIEPLQVQG